jgi:hypothetical protein
MIKPTHGDVGRRVLYRSHPNADPQIGRIVSLSDRYAYVCYDHDGRTHAIDPRTLEWARESESVE